MILADDPGPFDRYPVVGVVLVDRTTRCPCDLVIDGPQKNAWRLGGFGGWSSEAPYGPSSPRI